MSKIDFSGLWAPTRDVYGATVRASSWTRWAAVSLLVAALAGLLFGLQAPAALPNGDAAVYAQQIAEQDFQSRPVHRGYYVLMSALTGGASELDDQTLNRAHAVLAGATVGLTAFLAGVLCGGPAWGLLVLPVALAHGSLVENAFWTEVYGPQCFFLVATFVLVAGGRVAWAGLPLAMAVLITPSSLLAVPALLLMRPDLRSFLSLGLVGGSVTLGSLATVYEDYLWGDRGLLKASGTAVDLKMAVLKEGFEVVFGFFGFLGLLALGLAVLAGRSHTRPWLAVLAVWWAPHFFLGERFRDVPVQLGLWVLLIPVVVLGVREVARWGQDAASEAPDDLLFGISTAEPGLRFLPTVVIAGGFLALMPMIHIARSQVQRFSDLPSWTFPALVAAAGIAGLACLTAVVRPSLSTRRSAAGVAWAVGAVVGILWTSHFVEKENQAMTAYRDLSLAVHGQHGEHGEHGEIGEAVDGYRVIAGWSRGILYEHYLFQRSYVGIWINPAQLSGDWGDGERSEAEQNLQSAMDRGLDIYWLSAATEQKTGSKVIDMLKTRGYRFEEMAGGEARRGVAPAPEPIEPEEPIEAEESSDV